MGSSDLPRPLVDFAALVASRIARSLRTGSAMSVARPTRTMVAWVVKSVLPAARNEIGMAATVIRPARRHGDRGNAASAAADREHHVIDLGVVRSRDGLTSLSGIDTPAKAALGTDADVERGLRCEATRRPRRAARHTAAGWHAVPQRACVRARAVVARSSHTAPHRVAGPLRSMRRAGVLAAPSHRTIRHARDASRPGRQIEDRLREFDAAWPSSTAWWMFV